MPTERLKRRARDAEDLAKKAIAEAGELRNKLHKMTILKTRLVGENRQLYIEAKLLRDIMRADEARWLKRLWRRLTFSKAIVPADGSPMPVTQTELNRAAAAAKNKDQPDGKDQKDCQKQFEKDYKDTVKKHLRSDR